MEKFLERFTTRYNITYSITFQIQTKKEAKQSKRQLDEYSYCETIKCQRNVHQFMYQRHGAPVFLLRSADEELRP